MPRPRAVCKKTIRTFYTLLRHSAAKCMCKTCVELYTRVHLLKYHVNMHLSNIFPAYRSVRAQLVVIRSGVTCLGAKSVYFFTRIRV